MRRSAANAESRARAGPSPTTTSRNSGSRLGIAAIARPTPVAWFSRSAARTTTSSPSNGVAAPSAAASTPSGRTCVRRFASGTILKTTSRSNSEAQTIWGRADNRPHRRRVAPVRERVRWDARRKNQARTRVLATAVASDSCLVCTSTTSNGGNATRRRSSSRGAAGKRSRPATVGKRRMITPSRRSGTSCAGPCVRISTSTPRFARPRASSSTRRSRRPRSGR